MSFRARLTLFFVAIVVVPMVAVAVLVVKVTDDSRDGKADAKLSTALTSARTIYDDALVGAPDEARRIARQPSVGTALQALDRQELADIAKREADDPAIASVTFFAAGGKVLASDGDKGAIASSELAVKLPGAGEVGSIRVATLTAAAYARQLAQLTGDDFAVVSQAGTIASTRPLAGAELPDDEGGQTVDIGDESARVAALALDGAPPGTRVVAIAPEEKGFVASEPVVAVVLLAFFALAFLFIVLLLRILQGQVAAMLGAARRIGDGDFSQEVPVEGNDEMAGLAREFNKMSGQLSAQMSELRRQREELNRSVQRIGEAFASGLDRRALLEIVLDTATAATGAGAGRIWFAARDDPEAEVGEVSDNVARAMERASTLAVERNAIAGAEVDGAHAIAHPLTSAEETERALGSMALARAGKKFSADEREVLRYLIGQAAVSVENIGLHERLAEQAVTDALTGLSNNRHFREWMDRESARTRRFGGDLSLVMLDIDDFKAVNDTYGHLQGDAVLEMIGRVLRRESRGVDEPARYGGEEFVLALPETPKQGAAEVAERVRASIESSPVARVGADGEPLRVSASVGVATMPEDGSQVQELITAADDALYRAKRSGKNRVELATPAVAVPGGAQGNPAGRRS